MAFIIDWRVVENSLPSYKTSTKETWRHFEGDFFFLDCKRSRTPSQTSSSLHNHSPNRSSNCSWNLNPAYRQHIPKGTEDEIPLQKSQKPAAVIDDTKANEAGNRMPNYLGPGLVTNTILFFCLFAKDHWFCPVANWWPLCGEDIVHFGSIQQLPYLILGTVKGSFELTLRPWRVTYLDG